jgi:hypothetical protein
MLRMPHVEVGFVDGGVPLGPHTFVSDHLASYAEWVCDLTTILLTSPFKTNPSSCALPSKPAWRISLVPYLEIVLSAPLDRVEAQMLNAAFSLIQSTCEAAGPTAA